MSEPDKKDHQADGDQMLQLVEQFETEHADLLEAMRMFGISNAEYERAVRVLYGSSIFTSNST